MLEEDYRERRSALRFPVRIAAIYRPAQEHKEYVCSTCDISDRGLGLITEKGLTAGEQLEILLRLDELGQDVSGKCRVMWSTLQHNGNYRAGVKLEWPHLKPIPLVLKMIQKRRKY